MVRKALRTSVLALLVLVAVRPATAQNLGGCSAGVADPAALFVVPAPVGTVVVIDFTACPAAPVLMIQVTPAAACPPPVKTLTAVAGPAGAVFAMGGCVGGLLGVASCATVTVGAGPPMLVRIGAFDLNCSGGVGAADLSLCVSDFVLAPFEQRADYDKNGVVGAADLSRLIQIFVLGGSVATCAPLC